MFPDIRHPRTYVSLLLLALMFVVPLVGNTPFLSNLFVLLFVFSALSVAWNIVGGYVGQLSLGHAVFYGIGGYGVGLALYGWGATWVSVFGGLALALGLGYREKKKETAFHRTLANCCVVATLLVLAWAVASALMFRFTS